MKKVKEVEATLRGLLAVCFAVQAGVTLQDFLLSLARIGSDNGPDYELISSLKKTAGDRKIYVAGGVRHETDLNLLNDMGIDGVLIATALHTEQITNETLNKFTKKNAP